MAESDKAGVLLCMTEGGRQIFVMGHPEYDRYTLDGEYKRDRDKGLPIHVPGKLLPGGQPGEETAPFLACTLQRIVYKLAKLLRISDHSV